MAVVGDESLKGFSDDLWSGCGRVGQLESLQIDCDLVLSSGLDLLLHEEISWNSYLKLARACCMTDEFFKLKHGCALVECDFIGGRKLNC